MQSRWTPAVWLFPKGGVESDESAKAAAVRETLEEGGVAGEVGPKLGSWSFERGTKQKQKMWLLFVTTVYGPDSKMWKERKKRLRAWYTFAEARRKLTEIPEELRRPELLEMLQKTERTIKDSTNGVNTQESDSDAAKDSEDE